MRKLFSIIVTSAIPFLCTAQFHTVKVPRPSPKVTETQRLGITDITVDYHSPAVRGRDVWENVISSYDDSNLAWRAGANMNTTVKFSTDVWIEGKSLKAGSYGFHIDSSEEGPWVLMFAHHDNQWGSYYLDRANHVALKVEVSPVEAPFSEQLDYRFINRTDSSLVLALEWDEKRIPINISVDLDKTVLENFRYELLGVNTYRWEAWNDAANWCYDRNTNLEEGLSWANRSINGGYGGFASNKNFTNVSTKAKLLHALKEETELVNTVDELKSLMDNNAGEVYYFGQFLMSNQYGSLAEEYFEASLTVFGKENWIMTLGLGQAQKANSKTKNAIKTIEKALELAPDRSKNFVQSLLDEMKG